MSESPMFTFVGVPYLEYLPVVDLATGRLLGMEALVRWQHPEEGRISPNSSSPRPRRRATSPPSPAGCSWRHATRLAIGRPASSSV